MSLVRRLSAIGGLVVVTLGIAFAVLLVTATSTRQEPAGGPPQAMTLTRGWEFHPDAANRGLRARWQIAAPHGWLPVSVPHVFDPRPLPSLFRGTIGWYRLRFATPTAPAGFGWSLNFDQIRRRAQVFLNGRLIATHADPYTPFRVTLPPLRTQHPNELVIRVDNRKSAEPREGWWNWGGITRPVTLAPIGPLALGGLGLLPRVHCATPDHCTANVLLDATLTNRTTATASPVLNLGLTSPDGDTQTTTLRLPALGAHKSTRLHALVPVHGAISTWAPEHPDLYAARVELRSGRVVTERDQLNVGMREISVRDGLLYLNDRPLDMRGASIEEDMPGRGPILTANDATTIVNELRALHADVTRAQYPLDPALLDAFDRSGILVWSQAPIYHRDELLLTRAQRLTALGTLRGTLLATRNHPSVITESVANELSPTPDVVPATRAYLDAAITMARTLDPIAPVALDVLSYPNFPAQSMYRRFDLLGINNYFGWYTGKAGHSTASIDGLAPYLAQTHARYPAQALVMSEFGAEASVDGPPTEKQTFAFQTHYLLDTLRVVEANPFMSGAIYWTLREFAVKPHWDGGAHRPDVPHTSIHHKGLIRYGGTPKPAFQAAATAFAQTPLYRAPHTPGVPAAPTGDWPSGPGLMIGVAALAALLLAAAAARMLRPGRRRGVPRVDVSP